MAKTPTKKMISRFKFVRFCFLFLFLVVIGNLFYLQIIKHDELESKAISQQTQDTIIEAKRGSFLDRNGSELAVSASAYTITLSPANIKTPEKAEAIATSLAEALEMEYETVYEMTQRKVQYIEVKKRIEEEQMLLVNNILIDNPAFADAVGIISAPKRYYPHSNLLSSTLGFVGTDMQGLSGLEKMYDSYLSGTPGKVIMARTANGTALPFEYEKYIDAEDGCNISLTVDVKLQYILEKHIDEARVEHNVQNSVAGIIMDVKTGEILAIAQKPNFDPNNYNVINDEILLDSLSSTYGEGTEEYMAAYKAAKEKLWYNNKLCEPYETGSTFKIITSAMALEEGLVSLTETFHCVGHLNISGVNIHCHKTTGHGTETFKEGLANSCNPVFMTLAARVGPEKFYNYMTIFGFRETTNTGLYNEQNSILYNLKTLENKVNLSNASFGQGNKVTPLQLMSAVCSVANDGNYMQPYIIQSITDKNGNIVVANSPQVVKQTVSEKTSDILNEYLEYAVEKGKSAYIEGYRIAGKTGTSQKLDSADDSARIASFIGYAPADDPQICVLVIVDEPNSEVQYGSLIAAPLAKVIFQDVFDYLNIEPDYSDGTGVQNIKGPQVTKLTVEEAKAAIIAKGLVPNVKGEGETVIYQVPSGNASIPSGGTVILYTDQESSKDDKTTVPGLIGLTAAECNNKLINSDLNVKFKGKSTGTAGAVVISQSHYEGEVVSKGTVITVELSSS